MTLHSGCAEHGKPQHVTHLALRLRHANNGVQATVQNELASEKVFVQGCDMHGRPMFIVFAKQQEQGRPEETKRFICYTLDNVIATADPQKNELGQFLCLFDLSGNHAACLSESHARHQAQLKMAGRVCPLVTHVAYEWLIVHFCITCHLCLLTCKLLASKEGCRLVPKQAFLCNHIIWLLGHFSFIASPSTSGLPACQGKVRLHAHMNVGNSQSKQEQAARPQYL